MYATRTVHRLETPSSCANSYARALKLTAAVGTHCFMGNRKSSNERKKTRSRRRPRTSQRPQSLPWALKVLLQWLSFRQKLHGTCEFNKTWQPLFRSAALEEARHSNKSLDALGGVYITSLVPSPLPAAILQWPEKVVWRLWSTFLGPEVHSQQECMLANQITQQLISGMFCITFTPLAFTPT